MELAIIMKLVETYGSACPVFLRVLLLVLELLASNIDCGTNVPTILHEKGARVDALESLGPGPVVVVLGCVNELLEELLVNLLDGSWVSAGERLLRKATIAEPVIKIAEVLEARIRLDVCLVMLHEILQVRLLIQVDEVRLGVVSAEQAIRPPDNPQGHHQVNDGHRVKES
jgi:hypothetical protein